ncbi:hypothetical protein [Methylobacterium bullatum]|uniref:Uncharacterized protein n=1 Tax=Methylobacterium bullatum TaxID=570505 RepID=A0A679JHQ2_9HYPH|nr:hypothetical protein MBLL_00410 [Methylobacterium bullatum]
MAHWNIRARLIDLGVMEMGSDFVTYNGVKVVMPDGKREFLGKLTMHNEVNSVFTETQGEFVQLYLSGRRKKYPAVVYGMKTENEDVYFGASPLKPLKVQARLYLLVSVPLCLIFVGFIWTPFLIWWHCYLSFWDPPRRKVFDVHEPGTEVEFPGSPRKRLAGRQTA